MAAVAAPDRPRSLIGVALSGLLARRDGSGRKRLAALAAIAREHVVTVAALSAADFGGFTVFHHGGWFVLAGSLALLDFAVRG